MSKVLYEEVPVNLLRLVLCINLEKNMPEDDKLLVIMFYDKSLCSQTFLIRSSSYNTGFQEVRNEATVFAGRATSGENCCYIIALMSETEFTALLKKDKIDNEPLSLLIHNYVVKNLPENEAVAEKEAQVQTYNASAILQFFLGIILAISACTIGAFVPALNLSSKNQLAFILFSILLVIVSFLLVAKGANNLTAKTEKT